MEINVYTCWEATLFKAHLKVQFRFTDVKRPNVVHISISTWHFSSSEKKKMGLAPHPTDFVRSKMALFPLKAEGTPL